MQGVVNFYGLTDLTISDERYSYSENVPDWTVKSFLGAGTYQENLLKASAVHQVTEQAPSFLILHGTEDHVCPVENSMHLHEALERAGVYHEFYLVEGAEHGDDRFYQTEMMDIIKEFLQRILN